MSFLKRFSLVFLGFILLLFFFSFFLPSALKIERKIAIDASADMVFHQVDELKTGKIGRFGQKKMRQFIQKKIISLFLRVGLEQHSVGLVRMMVLERGL